MRKAILCERIQNAQYQAFATNLHCQSPDLFVPCLETSCLGGRLTYSLNLPRFVTGRMQETPSVTRRRQETAHVFSMRYVAVLRAYDPGRSSDLHQLLSYKVSKRMCPNSVCLMGRILVGGRHPCSRER